MLTPTPRASAPAIASGTLESGVPAGAVRSRIARTLGDAAGDAGAEALADGDAFAEGDAE